MNANTSTVLQEPSTNLCANITLISHGTKSSSKTVSAYDITGDGKKDTIRFVVEKKDSYWAKSLKIYVNGRLARTVTYGNSGFFTTGVTVKYLRLSDGTPFLFVKCNENNGDGAHQLLQYRSGTLQCVANYTDLPAGFGNHRHIDSATASGTTVKVTYTYMCLAAGNVFVTYDFRMNNGVLKRTSNTTSNVAYPVSGKQGNGKYYCAARRGFNTYTTTSLKTRKFYVSSGTSIVLNKAAIQSGKLYFEVKTSAGKTGWIVCPTSGSMPLLSGTFMAG